MKYRSMVIATALAVAGTAWAADENATTDDRYVDNMVECISDFIASEQDESTKENYIANCMQAKASKAQQTASPSKKG